MMDFGDKGRCISLLFFLLGTACVHADFSSCNNMPPGNLISATYTMSTQRIPVPGDFSASLQIQLDTPIDETVRAEVEIRRPVFYWSVRVPCVGRGQGIGSCTYSDICSMLTHVRQSCNGQPCTCPINPGTYTFNNLQISTNNLHPVIRRVARNTEFEVTIKFFNKSTNALLSCMETQLQTSG